MPVYKKNYRIIRLYFYILKVDFNQFIDTVTISTSTKNKIDNNNNNNNNNHRLRNSRNAECPGVKPDVLYFNPAAAGATDYKFPLAGEKLDQVN